MMKVSRLRAGPQHLMCASIFCAAAALLVVQILDLLQHAAKHAQALDSLLQPLGCLAVLARQLRTVGHNLAHIKQVVTHKGPRTTLECPEGHNGSVEPEEVERQLCRAGLKGTLSAQHQTALRQLHLSPAVAAHLPAGRAAQA